MPRIAYFICGRPFQSRFRLLSFSVARLFGMGDADLPVTRELPPHVRFGSILLKKGSRFSANSDSMLEFCRQQLRVSPRRLILTRDHIEYLSWCFAEAKIADKFTEKFGGVLRTAGQSNADSV
jgi:hypothetical protein